MKRSRLIVSILSLAVAGTACGQAPQDVPVGTTATDSPTTTASDDRGQLYEGTGLVLETPDRAPEFCLGGVDESLPPQCEGIPIVGWDWTLVDGEDKANGTSWGEFNLVGTYDGEIFTVQQVGPPKHRETAHADPIDTPCPEPAGGWTATDPARASQENVVDAQREASREPDFAGLWIDYYDQPPDGPTEEDPGNIVLNVAFTGDLDRHGRELRDLWGGPLCVTQHDHTLRDLQKIQNGFPAHEFDLDTLWSGIDVVHGTVEIAVVTIDAETTQRIDDRYGEGVVQVEARLKRVD